MPNPDFCYVAAQVLNWLRDGWCLLPKSYEERRELIHEVRFYQLTSMESWIRTQELLGDKAEYLMADGPASPGARNISPYRRYAQGFAPGIDR